MISPDELIGNGIRIRVVADHLDRFVGMLFQHEFCEVQHIPFKLDWVTRESDLAVWEVRTWEPLTLHPSIECASCGVHGYVREGRWVPAETTEGRTLGAPVCLPVTLTVGDGMPMRVGDLDACAGRLGLADLLRRYANELSNT